MKAIKYFLFFAAALAFAIVFVIFSLQNSDRIQLHLFMYSSPVFPISGHILLTFFLGMIFAGLFFAVTLMQAKNAETNLKRQVKKYEKELHALRNQPLDEVPQNKSVEVAKLVEDDEKSLPHFLQSP